MRAEEITRYHALLKVCDMACAEASRTGADTRSEFWYTLSSALQDDCVEQSQRAGDIAYALRGAERARQDFLSLLGDDAK